METWRKHAAVRDWFTPGKKYRAVEFLMPDYSRKSALNWLRTFAHKYRESAFQGHNPQHLNR
jgi:hypothetical protein